MKKKRHLIALSALFSILWAFSAWGYTINDTYWGGTVHNAAPTYGDVIGNPQFSVDGMNVTQNGTLMTVKIAGQYFSYYVSKYPIGGGNTVGDFGPGDLYISSHGWHTSGGSAATHFNTDQFTLSEGWDYVISRNGGIYQLSTNIANITMTNITPLDPNNWIYRENQAFIGGYNGLVNGYTNITLDSNGITFVFDTKNMHLGSEVGLHWTMRCGNDVVEGGVPVPEPSTILLLGAGILGAGIFVRKREK